MNFWKHVLLICNYNNTKPSLFLDGGCNIDDPNGEEDEDVHVCGSCKSAFGNVGMYKLCINYFLAMVKILWFKEK